MISGGEDVAALAYGRLARCVLHDRVGVERAVRIAFRQSGHSP
jgi:hypothetical protein